MKYLKEETREELLDRCYVDFVKEVVWEYKDSDRTILIQRWNIDTFKEQLMKLEKGEEKVIPNTKKVLTSNKKICRHTHTISITEEMIGSDEIIARYRNCTQCGVNITEEK